MKTKAVPFTFVRNGYYYYSRRVPTDLRTHYNKTRLVISLRTKTSGEAKKLALQYSSKLNLIWMNLRLQTSQHVIEKTLENAGRNAHSDIHIDSIKLVEATKAYIKAKNAGKGRTFVSGVIRNTGYLMELIGNKDLHEYTRKDALLFRDHLKNKKLSNPSIKRIFNDISAVFNFTISELALDASNPFSGVFIDISSKQKKRMPITNRQISKIQHDCYKIDDDKRWLVALLSDTGIRLSEGIGLLSSDIRLNSQIPHVIIRPNHLRRLKTESSSRSIPLIGASLWACTRLIQNVQSSSEPVFLRYIGDNALKANTAGATINKWLKPYLNEYQTLHSLRHSLRDRLRAVECPTEMIDQIGGWSRKSIGDNYGVGYQLKNLKKYLEMIVLDNNQIRSTVEH